MFDKHTEAECMDIFDCWIYIVKNMNMFEQMPFSEKYPVFRKLAEIGDLRKLSREELELYDEDIKNMRDIYITRRFSNISGAAFFVCFYVMQIVLSLLHVFKIFMIIFFNRQWDGFLHLLVEFAFFVFYER